MIAIVDYGAGNLNSVTKAFDYLGFPVTVTRDSSDLAAAEKVVLPGVGHFSALSALDAAGIRDALLEGIHGGKPFLGICLGMQWLFEGSEEAPELAGAGLLAGKCRQFSPQVKSPHVGWNSLLIAGTETPRLFRDLPAEPFVYFTHSFYAPVTAATSAITDYGLAFSAAVERDNVFGVQFHPEKSGAAGLRILKTFCEV